MKKALFFFVFGISEAKAQTVFDQMNDWVGGQLATGNSIDSLLFLFLGGVLASFLPCVYPVYPLTVNFLRNRKSSLGKFAHPTAYYFGLVTIYFCFGIIAALSGGAFNEILRLPLANIAIGALLFVMALATVDYLHLPYFGGQIDRKNNGLGGTFIMGAGAGLLSSACVGPIVVSILIGIASNSSALTFSMVFMAALKLMVFGAGVGIPVLLLGVFGMSLPKSGKWMTYVQWIFALLIGYFAYGYLIKGLKGVGISNQIGLYIFLGIVLVFVSAFQLQSGSKSRQERVKVALFTVFGVIGFFMIGSNMLAMNSSSVGFEKTNRTPALVDINTEENGNLIWHLNKEHAYQKASESGKLVFVDFHGDWCTNCKAFQKKALEDRDLNKALQNAVLYKVYDTSPEFEYYRNDRRFPELKIGLPFFLITDANGHMIYKTNDFTKTNEMILFLSES